MKKPFLLAGALLLSAPVLAQQPPVAAPEPAPDVVPAAEPSGYDLLVQAGGKILPGTNGLPSSQDKLTADENLRRQRVAVKRNAPALALVRQALQKPITVPLITDTKEPGLRTNEQMRELARQFWQEADVRLADGDFAGAMNSRLDIIEMGVAFERGNFISMSVGTAIEAIGRKDIAKIASHLDATQCRAAVMRLKAIEERRPTFTEVMQQEEQQTQILSVNTLGDLADVLKANATPEQRQNNGIDEAEFARIAALTPEKLRSDVTAIFATIIESAKRPFSASLTIQPPAEINPLLQVTLDTFAKPQSRFSYERAHAANLLLLGGLELRAQKLEAGTYPDTFTTPVDPFSPNASPLVYKKTNEGYLLYSVGPDGKDDNGAALQTLRTNPTTGVRTIVDQLMVESTGDIVQEVL